MDHDIHHVLQNAFHESLILVRVIIIGREEPINFLLLNNDQTRTLICHNYKPGLNVNLKKLKIPY